MSLPQAPVAPLPAYAPSPTLKTPADYIVFHPSVAHPLPSPRPVGLLRCQLDPLAQTLKTTIVAVRGAAAVPNTNAGAAGKAAGKDKDKGKRGKATDAPAPPSLPKGCTLLQLELEDTVLFPEGGGQPSDSGTLALAGGVAEGERWQVLHVLRRGLTAVHFVVVPEEAEASVEVGKEVVLNVNWERRMDLMSHHSAQHLLSALLDQLPTPANTLSWSLAPAPAPCYVELSRDLSPDEIADVERRANALIRSGTRVTVEVEDQEVRDGGAALSEGEREKVRESRKGIPKDYERGVVRTVVIDGVDRNPCCGSHLPSLALLSALHVLPTTAPHTSSTRRLFFLASDRLTTYTREASRTLAALSATLGGTLPATLPERVGALAEGSKAADKNVKALRSELAELVGAGLQAAVLASDDGGAKGVVYRHRDATTDASAGTDFLGAVANAVFPAQVAEDGAPKLLVLSASSPAGHALHLSGTPSLVAAFGEALKQAPLFAGRIKGGGAKGRWQAKLAPGGAFGLEERTWIEGAVDKVRKGL